MEWFQPAWETLSEDARYVLEQFYWEDNERFDTLSEICDKYSIERTSAYKKKNRAIASCHFSSSGSKVSKITDDFFRKT